MEIGILIHNNSSVSITTFIIKDILKIEHMSPYSFKEFCPEYHDQFLHF